MTPTTPADEVPLPAPVLKAGEPVRRFAPSDLWNSTQVRTYADARAAHAVKLERARVVAWLRDCEEMCSRLSDEHKVHGNSSRSDAHMHKAIAYDRAVSAIERGDHLPAEESPHA